MALVRHLPSPTQPIGICSGIGYQRTAPRSNRLFQSNQPAEAVEVERRPSSEPIAVADRSYRTPRDPYATPGVVVVPQTAFWAFSPTR